MADHMTAETLRAEIVQLKQYAQSKRALSAPEMDSALVYIAGTLRNVAMRLSGMAAVPEGWKLVPIVPTEQQMRAAESAITAGAFADPPTSGCGRCHRTAYDAAVSAAPEPPHV